MRIIAGLYKGKRISAGPEKSIRPMTNRNKEIIFSILDDFFVDRRVLDLFCGSGSLGLESLSRGAAQLTFVDQDKSSVQILKENINTLKIDYGRVNVIACDALTYLEKESDSHRLIFADPPFRYDKLQILVNMIFNNHRLDKDGILVLHHEKTNPIQPQSPSYCTVKQKKAGRSLITFLAQENKNV